MPWWPVIITLLAIVTAAFAVDPVRDPATLGPVAEARLDPSPSYVLVSPLSETLDTLSLLTVGQHVAIVLWAMLLFGAWRAAKQLDRPSAEPRWHRARREALAGVAFVLCLFIVYAAAALLPRPMAQLEVTDDQVLAVDFHSHTKYSHDGRPGWTEDDVRAWHRGAGFDAAYITDHATYDGAERGVAANPAIAGDGEVLLQGLEAYYRGEHVNVLSAGRVYKGLTTPNLKDLDTQAVALASLLVPTSPVIIETLPGNLAHVAAASPGQPGASAIEIVDGSPRGLAQTRRDRARILGLADSLNLALVTGSDNHGWGRTAPGWTLLRIPGWRGMHPDSLSRIVEDVLRVGRRQGTRTVERRVAGGTTALSLVFAAPVVAWRMFTTFSPDERVDWIIWAWALLLLGRALRRYRLRPSARA